MKTNKPESFPVIKNIEDFDRRSGNCLERLIFNNRIIFLILCAIVAILLGCQATQIKLTASFDKMVPKNHPYIRNYLNYNKDLAGLGNVVRVVVENRNGTIFDKGYLELLKNVTDELMLTPGTDRPWIRSLWMAAVRWNSVTEVGFLGGPVMPKSYTGSQENMVKLRNNILRADIVGSLVASDMKSSMVVVPLQDKDPETQEPLNLNKYAKALEKVRAMQTDQYRIHIVGFAKLVGDLIAGITKVMAFFIMAVVIAAIIVYIYTRCWRATLTLISCSIVAVLWLTGLLNTLGYDLNPYSILVPFLIFAIGISHGAQKMNGMMQDIGRGSHKYIAARYTFRRLFIAGVTALLSDAFGFTVLMMIDIPVIRDLAVAATLGVAILIFTSLLLLPVLLSYIGVCPKAAERSLKEETDQSGIVARACGLLSYLTERKWAAAAILCAIIFVGMGLKISSNIRIGDLDEGAPELRSDSRYNRDNHYINTHYNLSSDVFAIIVTSPEGMGITYEALKEMERLQWELQQLPGVQASYSATDAVKSMTAATGEGNPKWYTLSRYQNNLDYGAGWAIQNKPELVNYDATVLPIVVYLEDHKAETLTRVVETCEAFLKNHDTEDRKFRLAAGTAGIEAATNIVVEKANRTMMLFVYLVVLCLCFITFRSWRAVLVAVLPLMLTSILCEALMVKMGIGVKVATLPVIALGVGIGVDYALYLVSILLQNLRTGMELKEAYLRALYFTGKVVALIGVTLAAGVFVWAFSPIKFQADMGVLLGFMFLWNMIGALVLVPALSCFLMQPRWIVKESCCDSKDGICLRRNNESKRTPPIGGYE